jgi:hypothetical protein
MFTKLKLINGDKSKYFTIIKYFPCTLSNHPKVFINYVIYIINYYKLRKMVNDKVSKW